MSLFICGTGTNVGKTIVSSVLLKEFFNHESLRYWKPVQTGLDDDAKTVTILSGVLGRNLPKSYHFSKPLSPHLAAEFDGQSVDLDFLVERYAQYSQKYNLIVEGAGGLLVPLNRKFTWLDFLKKLKLPVLLVARSELGTINHSLLTLSVLKKNKIPVVGMVFFGTKNLDNMKTICEFGNVENVGHCEYDKKLFVHYFKKEILSGYLE